MMDYMSLINRYYPDDNELRRLLLLHSRQVAKRCQEIVRKHPELNVDGQFLEEAAMLHDIGIFRCNAPSIYCMGTEPYLRHGLIGGELLRSAGYIKHARVCERHTGTGLTKEEIVRRQLPLPAQDFIPETLEEQIVCYADKFYSKSRPDHVLTVDETVQSIRKFGEVGAEKFMKWVERFE